jgi:hypothetical protein
MMTMGARIEAVSRELLTAARSRAADLTEAHLMAHKAFLRILQRDPELRGYREVGDALRRETPPSLS